MSELHSILRKMDPPPRGRIDPTKLSPGFHAVMVDAAGQRIEPGFWQSFFGGGQRGQVWLVQPDVPCRLDRRVIELSDAAFEETAFLDSIIEVTIPEGTYPQAVEALTRDGNPVLKIVDAFRQAAQSWFREDARAKSGIHALERIARNISTLTDLANEVGSRLHVSLTVYLAVDHEALDPNSAEAVLRDVGIAVPEFNLSLSDRLSHQVIMAFDVTLRRDGTIRQRPPIDESGWREYLRRLVVREAPRRIATKDYYGDPDALAAAITGICNTALAPFGRQVRHIDVRAKSLLPVPSMETVDLDIEWTGRPSGHRITFKISATMKVDPNRRQVFIARGAPAYEAWLTGQAKSAIEAHLVAADFVDLAPEFVKKLEMGLKATLSEAAAQDGMLIEVFVAKPDVPEIVRTRTMRFNTRRQTYQTRDGSFEVALEISVAGSFTELSHVTSLLQTHGSRNEPRTDLEERMSQIVIDATAQVLRGAYADRYVLRFDPFIDVEGKKDHSHIPEGVTPDYLADNIRAKIRTELKRSIQFHCDLEDIQLVQRDDKIADLVRMIFELRSFLIKTEVESVDTVGVAYHLPVRVTYQVQAVEPGSILVVLRQDYDRERLHSDIKGQLEIWTKDILSAKTYKELRAKEFNQKINLRSYLNDKVLAESRRFFGTVVTVQSIEVDPSAAEALALDRGELDHLIDRHELNYRRERLDDPDFRNELRSRLAVERKRNTARVGRAPEEPWQDADSPKQISSDREPSNDQPDNAPEDHGRPPRLDGGLF
jgi:hypothetical protein